MTDFGDGRDEHGQIFSQPQVAERLLLVDIVEAGDWRVVLPHAVAIRSGETYWIVWSSLFIRSQNGEVRVIEGVDSHWICR
ncbi:hypothetical protein [Catellatospora sp. NPDC049133]|uniref:hypothetical protein n=1 Tax=Catellatospora sp. NPDC049133 TaxID=3155499 RepID=UPI0033C53AA4